MNIDFKVSLQLLKGSGHVQHLKNYPEDHLNQIGIFTADYCLKKNYVSIEFPCNY